MLKKKSGSSRPAVAFQEAPIKGEKDEVTMLLSLPWVTRLHNEALNIAYAFRHANDWPTLHLLSLGLKNILSYSLGLPVMQSLFWPKYKFHHIIPNTTTVETALQTLLASATFSLYLLFAIVQILAVCICTPLLKHMPTIFVEICRLKYVVLKGWFCNWSSGRRGCVKWMQLLLSEECDSATHWQ